MEVPVPAITDGIYPDFSRAKYDSLPFTNYSLLEPMGQSPAHCREFMLSPRKPTPALELGTAVHCAVLESEKFRRRYVVPPKVDRRKTEDKKIWDDFLSANQDKECLDSEQFEQCLAIAEAVWKHPLAKELLSGFGRNEVCAVWTDKATGQRCKSLIDRFSRWAGWSCVIDLKTTLDASPAGFAKSVYNFGYHERAAYYLGGLSAISPAQRKWFWIAVEKERPFATAVYEPDEDMLALGKEKSSEYLRRFAECRAKNSWPGFSDGSVTLRLPPWAKNGA